VSDRVGQVLGGRYRLLGPIGTGASATVYLADDVVLRRRVAVKVLHAALADDAAFLKRFQAEARAAAALNHPHVMAVHDWGQGDVPYLVTELLGGGSLRGLLDAGPRLDVAQARAVGLEAARGLDYAHRRGFVHRDIKPANLLFDEDGRLRIADFGLARALAEAAWTEPAGAVLGTARYASPEQAQGRPLDGRSDVYSLALVLIEAVSGEVPFTADTTLGTLMARVDNPLPVPEELGELGPALVAAGHPDPDERPDASAFATLLMAAGDLGPLAPLPLAGTATIDPDAFEPREPTTLYVPERQLRADLEPAIMAAPTGTTTNGLTILGDGVFDDEALQPETVKVQRPMPDETDVPLTRAERRRRRREDKQVAKLVALGASAEALGADPLPVPAEVRNADSVAPPRRRRRGLLVAGIVLGVLLIAGGATAAWFLTRTPTHTLVSFVGGPVEAAVAALEADNLVPARNDVFDDVVPAGTVLGQDPAAGVTVDEGSTVTLTVSLGPPPVVIPTDLGGKPLDQVTNELAAVGLKVGEVLEEFDENWPKDTVLRLAPGTPAEVPKGSSVGFVVSGGPAPRTVPAGLVGSSADAASAALRAEGLVAATREAFSDTVAVGVVIATDPGSGATVPRDSTVTLTVSKGPETVVIPASIVGQTVVEASTTLQGLGLSVSGIQGSPLNRVTGTNPAVGQSVRKGTAVTLVTG
jgi:serine/threonine-protein kinase